MRIILVISFVCLYFISSIRPLVVLAEDWLAHTFWLVAHYHSHHHSHGHDHVIQELKEDPHTSHAQKDTSDKEKKKEVEKDKEISREAETMLLTQLLTENKKERVPLYLGNWKKGFALIFTPPPEFMLCK
ncbi:hypothetical protein V6R21_05295 [Limibacter armeniacum]|uniref:hypothetical protein n=1 Tax=Limibacter armeniacum TaxID=466084 RepID=UPI002FE5830A